MLVVADPSRPIVQSPKRRSKSLGLTSWCFATYYYCVWIIKAIRFLVFVTLLSPGFIQMAWWLITNRLFSAPRRKLLSFRYGENRRNVLDLYMPVDDELIDPNDSDDGQMIQARPVIIFLSGGGWTIGYKDWGAWIGMMLAKFGVIAVVPDYRNFPQTTVEGMIDDVTKAVQWTIDCIGNWGGDVGQIHLVGQSAGAHLAALALLNAAKKISDSNDSEALRPWAPNQLKSFMGISGPYNLESLCDHHLQKGLELRNLLGKIMMNDMDKFSPTSLLSRLATAHGDMDRLLPPMRLYHGSLDSAVPQQHAVEFHELLCKAAVKCDLVIFEGKTHTDLIIEDPIAGKDVLLEEILKVVLPDSIQDKKLVTKPMMLSLCVRIARAINPF
eukprot:TRINITY_DN5470_c0_g1_i1.p1 TRINITY_DN5470_c0_g1~~TRINITY_DN5470_c0_g1_i1.p1  ORF type:complete len:385 (+),score=64.76 TRINITY_DN5470_c0_g1_i1:120-1274(+)